MFVDLIKETKESNMKQNPTEFSLVLYGKVLQQCVAVRTLSLGTALLSLFSGGDELPKHGEDAVTIGNLAQGLCVPSLDRMEKAMWSFLNSSNFKVL